MNETIRAIIEEEIIRASAENIERLPMLEKIFERLTQGLAGALRSFSGIQTEPTLDGVLYRSTAEALGEIEESWLAAICQAEGSDGTFLIALEPKLLFSLLEIMLGGRAAEPSDWTPRSFTSIEKRLAQQVTEIVLRELGAAFAPIEAVTFRLSHLESSPQAAILGPAASPATRIGCSIDLEGRGGQIAFVIPHGALGKLRERMTEVFMGEELGHDEEWQVGMQEALTETRVKVTAMLRRLRVPLVEALKWKPGTVIDLGLSPEDEVVLSTSKRAIAHGSIGRRRSGHSAVRITRLNLD